MQVEHCMRGVNLAHYGACSNSTGVKLLMMTLMIIIMIVMALIKIIIIILAEVASSKSA